jgi:hypothetical protein
MTMQQQLAFGHCQNVNKNFTIGLMVLFQEVNGPFRGGPYNVVTLRSD